MITGEVQTWHHTTKGEITGVLVHEARNWIVVKLVGNQSYADDGHTCVLAKASMTLIPGASA